MCILLQHHNNLVIQVGQTSPTSQMGEGEGPSGFAQDHMLGQQVAQSQNPSLSLPILCLFPHVTGHALARDLPITGAN